MIAGHRTSIALEPEFWDVLDSAAATRGVSVAALAEEIDAARPEGRLLASACRVYALRVAQGAGS